jgi:hypothetical protein
VIAVYLQPKMVARLKRREMVSEGYTATLVASVLLVTCSNLARHSTRRNHDEHTNGTRLL